MMDRYSLPHKVFLYFCVAIFLGFILLPFFEMFMTSLRPLEHLFRSPYQFWSDDFSFRAYSQMWETVPMLPRYIANSMLISLSVTALSLAFIIPAAYAYARFDFKGKSVSLGIFLAVNMFSGAVLLIPLYKLLRNYGLLNTYFAMIVPGAASCCQWASGFLNPIWKKSRANWKKQLHGWCQPSVHPAPCGSATGRSRSHRGGCGCVPVSLRTAVPVRDHL